MRCKPKFLPHQRLRRAVKKVIPTVKSLEKCESELSKRLFIGVIRLTSARLLALFPRHANADQNIGLRMPAGFIAWFFTWFIAWFIAWFFARILARGASMPAIGLFRYPKPSFAPQCWRPVEAIGHEPCLVPVEILSVHEGAKLLR